MTTFFDYRKKLRGAAGMSMDEVPYGGHKDCKARDPDNCRMCHTGKYSEKGKEEAKEEKREELKADEKKAEAKNAENAAEKSDDKKDEKATEEIKEALKKSDGGAVVVKETKEKDGDTTPAVAAVVKKDDDKDGAKAPVEEACEKGDNCSSNDPKKRVFNNNAAAKESYTFTAEDVRNVTDTIKNDADIVSAFQSAVGCKDGDPECSDFLKDRAVRKAVFWCFYDNPECYTASENPDTPTVKATNGKLINLATFLADVKGSVGEAAIEEMACGV